MYLEKLTINNLKTKEEIRSISFVRGLNIITDDSEKDGNSVGKTTILHAIDFCLGAKSTVFQQSENSSLQSTKILDFLYENQVEFILEMRDLNEQPCTIKRRFVEEDKIDSDEGKRYTMLTLPNKEEIKDSPAFLKKLKPILFGNDNNRPTSRELLGFFLRNTPDKLKDPLKFSHGSQSSINYQMILNRLFYRLSDDDIVEIDNSQKELKNIQTTIKYFKLSGSTIKSLKKNIETSDKDSETLDLFQNPIDKNLQLSFDEYQEICQKISYLKLKIVDIEKVLKEYNESNISDIDSDSIKYLCEEFNLYDPKTRDEFNVIFKDTVQFHKALIENRRQFLQELLQEYNVELKDLIAYKETANHTLESNKQEKQQLEPMIKENLQKTLQIWEEKEVEKKELTNEIYNLLDNDDEKNLQLINDILLEYSTIINELTTHKKNKTPKLVFKKLKTKSQHKSLTIINAPEVGTGFKAGFIAVLQLAYLEFLFKKPTLTPIIAPRFMALDIIEPIQGTALQHICDKAREIHNCGQFIIPILSEKISDINIEDTSIILKLSKDKKFFKFD